LARFDRLDQSFTFSNLTDEDPITNGCQVTFFAATLQSAAQLTNQNAVIGLDAEKPGLGADNQTGLKILG
jgi:hypothetical protein